MVRIIGIDLSLNHAGIVELNDRSECTWYQYVTDKSLKNAANKNAANKRGARIPLQKTRDKQQRNAARLWWWRNHLRSLFADRKPAFVGIEDYAFRAQSNSAYQIGELGGVARVEAIAAGAFLRCHDPLSVKMYVAHSGNASPQKVADNVLTRWAAPAEWRKLKGDAFLDLCVAFGVARMVLDELKLRQGHTRLSDMHPQEVRVYNRCTKANPVNLLGRELWCAEAMEDVEQ